MVRNKYDGTFQCSHTGSHTVFLNRFYAILWGDIVTFHLLGGNQLGLSLPLIALVLMATEAVESLKDYEKNGKGKKL